ncbi:hypothetical protein [Marinospirillum insulare]|uniref:Pre-peptidase C-terminal domain-containing protein n=1 Tax=Marinospirillum insulare TaxID=217169 RepID=A0ABQ5ZZ15_9GAMM|nr:hypothetical protein [Marinospirillum insulare]GLR63243.1 hypothetical protein GCM10007878_06780 [Marinospirillum insulare]
MLEHRFWLVFIFTTCLALPLHAKPFPDNFIKLEPGTSYEGLLNPKEVMRFYFVLERGMDVVLESHTSLKRTNNVYPGAVLFHADGSVIKRDWNGGQGRNFRISESLEAGTYVLRVEDGRGCGSLHGCPEIIKDFSLTFDVEETTPF